MATTTSPRIATGAFPLVLDDLKYALFDPIDDTEMASQTFAAPHPARSVSFMGMDRQNYVFRLLRMVGGIPVEVKQEFPFVPDRDDIQYRDPEMLQAGVTVGFTANVNTVTFDGTAGAPDFRGWDLNIERMPTGTMVKDVAYSWDKITGILTLLGFGDQFNQDEYFNFIPFLIISETGGVPVGRQFGSIIEIDADTTLVAADVGKKILISGITDYLEVTLPDVTTVIQRRTMFFESGIGAHKCVKIKVPDGSGQIIDFGKGNRDAVYMGVCESFELYRQGAVWRISGAVGNFLTVGRNFATDAAEDDEFNSLLMDGRALNVQSYARLYNDFVLKLDPSQVTTYAGWATNPTKYSYADVAGPTGVFRIPDRRDRHERNTPNGSVPGTFDDQKLLQHQHIQDTSALDHLNGGSYGHTDASFLVGTYGGPVSSNRGLTSRPVAVNGTAGVIIDGTENKVKIYFTNRFVLI